VSRRSHQLRVRWMRQADADDMLYVERCVFGRTQGDVRQLLEWTEKPTSLAIVAEKHHRIIGYLLARHRTRAEKVRILNIAVHSTS
jgi:predicted N-acetyltransferase YhbS